MNESMNDKAVYRTAPATPGLLNISHIWKTLNLLTGSDNGTKTKKIPQTKKNFLKNSTKMSCVICNMSHVMCHVSCVTCQQSPLTSYLSPVINANSNSHRPSRLTPPLFTVCWFTKSAPKPTNISNPKNS